MIDFDSDRNVVLINPRMPRGKASRLRSWLVVAEALTGHVFVVTSGSTAVSEADWKWVALSKTAILESAQAVNAWLRSDSADIWLHCLPEFHVGGLGIRARATLTGGRVERLKVSWSPTKFVEALAFHCGTLASLVPTQVYDLVAVGLRSPPCLRAVLVGGGVLGPELYERARCLGWPMLPSYGLTETASCISAANLDSLDEALPDGPSLELLPHAEARIRESDGRILVRARSSLTGYISIAADGHPHFWDPKDSAGWFATEDFGYVGGKVVTVLGRASDRIKIGGETVNLAHLRRVWQSVAADRSIRTALSAAPDDRLENVIVIYSEVEEDALRSTIESFNAAVLPFERIRVIRVLEAIPRTELGKVKWGELDAGG